MKNPMLEPIGGIVRPTEEEMSFATPLAEEMLRAKLSEAVLRRHWNTVDQEFLDPQG